MARWTEVLRPGGDLGGRTTGGMGLPAGVEGRMPGAAAAGGAGVPAGGRLGVVAAWAQRPAARSELEPGGGLVGAPGRPGHFRYGCKRAFTAGNALVPAVLARGLPAARHT